MIVLWVNILQHHTGRETLSTRAHSANYCFTYIEVKQLPTSEAWFFLKYM